MPQFEMDDESGEQTDERLLTQFASRRDESAFTALVNRHGGLVWEVARRVLPNRHDVEDVFQAVFLVLARDVSKIRNQRSLANWLFGVTLRLARMVARGKVRRRESELTEMFSVDGSDISDQLIERNDRVSIFEELENLPHKYRETLVLHYLTGKTQKQISEELGLTVDAVDGLLKRGRKELRERLMRRGIALGTAVAFLEATSQAAHAAEFGGLVSLTVRGAVAYTAKTTLVGITSLRAAELAGKAVTHMSMTKSLMTAGLAIGATSLIGGIVVSSSLASLRNLSDKSNEVRIATAEEPLDEVNFPPSTAAIDVPELPIPKRFQNELAQNSPNDSKPGNYASADEAYARGAAFYNNREFDACREPFEAALKLAPDVKYRIKVYRALLAAYRQLPEIDKFVEAADYIITNSEQPAERSIIRTDLLSFVHQRGKTNDLVSKYEDVLKKDPKNLPALFILSEVYADLKKDPKRSAELLEQMFKLSSDQGQAVNVPAAAKLAQQYFKQKKFKESAELFEKIAPMDATLAPWHWKEAALAWMKDGNKTRAVAAAKSAIAAGPERRGEQLLHFWHRSLGQVLLDGGEPSLAIEQFEAAIKYTTIDGYLKDTQKELATAREQAAQRK